VATLSRALDGVGAALPKDRERTALILHGAAASLRESPGSSSRGSLLEDDVAARRRHAGASGLAAWAEGTSLARADAARLALAQT
jgi:hypothetical protein